MRLVMPSQMFYPFTPHLGDGCHLRCHMHHMQPRPPNRSTPRLEASDEGRLVMTDLEMEEQGMSSIEAWEDGAGRVRTGQHLERS